MRFAITGYALALPANEVVLAGVVVFPEVNEGDNPQVKVMEARGLPLPVK